MTADKPKTATKLLRENERLKARIEKMSEELKVYKTMHPKTIKGLANVLALLRAGE